MSRDDLRARIDACVHCGLCLPACPTYASTGSELDSPRGRIDLVRGLADGALADTALAARHLDRCLGCRACETACPSGVRYAEILHGGRDLAAADRPTNSVVSGLLATFATPSRITWTMRLGRLLRLPVLRSIGESLPGSAGAAARVAPDTAWTPWSRTRPGTLPATGARRGAVVLLPGCVMDHAHGRVHDASATLLRAAGYDVHVPRGPLCCGALHAHAGDAAASAAWSARLGAALPPHVDALVVDAAGCGSHLKETPGPWSGRTFDVLEFLDARGLGAPLGPVAAALGVGAARVRVAWTDPCHLAHGQGVRDAPRRLLAAIPDADLVPLRDADRCCGSAGAYNIAQPELADAALRAKVAAIRDAAPHVLVTANPGCMLQIESGLLRDGVAVPVLHAVELLATAHVAGSGVIAEARTR